MKNPTQIPEAPDIITLTGWALTDDTDYDGISAFDETRDLNPVLAGIQNPFDFELTDVTGDNGSALPDGVPDGINDWDGDGIDNRDEFLLGLNPIQHAALMEVTVSNIGNWPMTITNMQITGANAADFSIAGGGGYSVVPAGEEHTVGVIFTPHSTGAKSAMLYIYYFDGVTNKVKTVPLSGTGT